MPVQVTSPSQRLFETPKLSVGQLVGRQLEILRTRPSIVCTQSGWLELPKYDAPGLAEKREPNIHDRIEESTRDAGVNLTSTTSSVEGFVIWPKPETGTSRSVRLSSTVTSPSHQMYFSEPEVVS